VSATLPVRHPVRHEHVCFLPHALARPCQEHRLAAIRRNLIARVAEAERGGWHGETEGHSSGAPRNLRAIVG
jgi:hypothetical protein